jgi:dTDP-4-amino-4,6-dideoxygalactose transaminase
MTPFNKPPRSGREKEFVLDALESAHLSGDGRYARLCQEWFAQHYGTPGVLLTPSCTHALEMAALLLDIQPGDEVILPSYTFVSTANAFALRGAQLVFVDVDPVTMNIDAALIEAAITPRTRAIVLVHYAGVACDMDAIMPLAQAHRIPVIEDAAQAIGASYKGRRLGTFGAMSTLSFHETKNITSGGEGGLLVVNDERLFERAEIIREKGTNRKKFFRGMVDKYSWVDIGSSYLPSELQCAYLWGQLAAFEEITASRLAAWQRYRRLLAAFRPQDASAPPVLRVLPAPPPECQHNGHLFFLKLQDARERARFIEHMKAHDIMCVFHYVPLHSSVAGQSLGRFSGKDRYTTRESERLVRLPLWHGLPKAEIDRICERALEFDTPAKAGRSAHEQLNRLRLARLHQAHRALSQGERRDALR